MHEQSDNTLSTYDRLRATVNGLFTRPTTVKIGGSLRAKTFVIETCRSLDTKEDGTIKSDGDYIFIEVVDENGVTRLVLPPKVADAIASQRDRLTDRRRSSTAKRLAKERMDRGERPAFLR